MIKMLEPVTAPVGAAKGSGIDCYYDIVVRVTVSKHNLLTTAEKATADYIAKKGWGECTVAGLQGYIRIAHGLEVGSSVAQYMLLQAFGMV
jgi:hypothetical protein